MTKAEYQKEWRKKNRVKCNAYTEKWRLANKEKDAAAKKLYRSRPEFKERNRQRQAALRAKVGSVKLKYGITIEQWEVMKSTGCGICGTFDNLVVDHCHKTNKVRGALCSSCNCGIGFLRENTYFLYNAILWLEDC